MRHSSNIIRQAGIGVLAFVFGCGSAPSDRCAVSGTLRGLESQDGIISFVPEAGTEGPSVRTTFSSGRYVFDAAEGPKPGRYVVLVWVNPESPSTDDVKSVPLDELKTRMTEKGKPISQLAVVPKAVKAVVDLEVKLP